MRGKFMAFGQVLMVGIERASGHFGQEDFGEHASDAAAADTFDCRQGNRDDVAMPGEPRHL
jgi:hypothetical protein